MPDTPSLTEQDYVGTGEDKKKYEQTINTMRKTNVDFRKLESICLPAVTCFTSC